MDAVDRIFNLLDNMDIEQQAFAATVGVSDDTASNWRRRKSASYSKYLPQIAEALDTTVDYILTGKAAPEEFSQPLGRGERLPENKRGPTTVSDDEAALDEELISRLCQLTPEELEKVDAFVQGILASR